MRDEPIDYSAEAQQEVRLRWRTKESIQFENDRQLEAVAAMKRYKLLNAQRRKVDPKKETEEERIFRVASLSAKLLKKATKPTYVPLKTIHDLISEGADVNKADLAQETILSHAANLGRLGLVELLLKLGADPNIPDCQGYTPLDRAISSYSPSSQHVITLLLDAGAKLNTLSPRCGRTPLCKSIYSMPKKAELLLNAGADPNMTNADGCVPLHESHSCIIINLLLDAGGNLNIFDDAFGTSAAILKDSSNLYTKLMFSRLCVGFEDLFPLTYSLASLCIGEMDTGLSTALILDDEILQRRRALEGKRESVTYEILDQIYQPLQSITSDQSLTSEQDIIVKHIVGALITSTHCKREDIGSVSVTTDAVIEFLNAPEMAAARRVVLAEVAKSKRKIGPSTNDCVREIMKARVDHTMKELKESPNFNALMAEMRECCYDAVGGKRFFLTKAVVKELPKDIAREYFLGFSKSLTPKQLIEIAIKKTTHSRHTDYCKTKCQIKKLSALHKYSKMFDTLEKLGATEQLMEVLEVQDTIAAATAYRMELLNMAGPARARELNGKDVDERESAKRPNADVDPEKNEGRNVRARTLTEGIRLLGIGR